MTGISGSTQERPPIFKAVGVSLAVASGVFIGISFVLKKKGLLAANVKDGKEAGEGYGYLKNAWWWTGMILMILGEICNFAAYAFVDALLVTPLGALSVVITAILSSIFLKERLSFVGKIGCFMCIIGAIVIAINAPAQSSVTTIQDMQKFIISPGFLVYAGIIIIGCICIIIWVAPKYGNKSMMVYLTVCSLTGGLSVVATQGLGAAVVTQIGGTPQFNQWFLYVLLVFVIVTLLVEIIYLNKALNLFNAALVTPTYYVIFTSATIVTSAILFRGFKGTPASITTVVMGFLQICSGVVLLQLSKSSKNVPDTEIFRGDLDQIRTVAEQSEPESEPKADAIRGTAAIIRRISVARRTAEVDEARKIHEDRQRDMRTPLSAGETVEWDGVKRRVTWTGEHGRPGRRNTLSGQHPPLGMARIPDEEEAREDHPAGRRRSMSVDEAMRQRVYGQEPEGEEPHPESFLGRVRGLLTKRSKASLREPTDLATIVPHRDLRDISGSNPIVGMSSTRPRVYSDATLPDNIQSSAASQSSPHINHITFAGDVATEMKTYDFAAAPVSAPGYQRTTSRDGSEYQSVPSGRLAVPEPSTILGGKSKDKDSLRPDSRQSARRQFSFQFLHRNAHGRSESQGSVESDGGGRHGLNWKQKLPVGGSKTEEERLGLVKGDSVSTGQETLRSDSPSSVEKDGSVNIVPRDDDIPSGEWNEKWGSRGT
ncbi:magnesium transporter NIPA-domain-containing protein [Tricharina praecox]|uniref:magnesium transporter NIPA-domain-containing protein n=1 Tax=Tricharina praecox TaxID=43433 RepID=UPI00221E9C57|nr:magnesium transporter NIPA-domain-containing protein [Tricharina praecox]KAI5850607.1 magnesium transporter NIPA-domain-containing protein [Tricharina praecox]